VVQEAVDPDSCTGFESTLDIVNAASIALIAAVAIQMTAGYLKSGSLMLF
jgi:hypothetical protein